MTGKVKTNENELSKDEEAGVDMAIATLMSFAGEICASKQKKWELLSHLTMTIQPNYFTEVMAGFLEDAKTAWPDEYPNIVKAMGKDVRH